ncbi:MAG: hypothetical protein FJ255_05935 [Phycisphaerae bacterium]|nr:hypothetical protein [Phycisphaerae bacterium]
MMYGLRWSTVWVHAAIAWLVGCGSAPGPGPVLGGDPFVATAAGDWEDVDAAVSLAVGEAEVAVVERLAPAPGRIEFRLLSAGEEPGLLVVERRGDGLSLEARVGRWGRPETERRLIERVARRLARLRGVEAAPAR